MTGVASLGALETAYLTATKLGGDSVLCTVSGSCQDVLNGPYAVIPFTDNVPLSALGCAAYTLTALVAVAPLLVNDNDDDNNRIALLILTTGLGTFSTLLMFLLTTVLHESCLYCLASASLSWTLCASAWFGGILPDENDEHRIPALQSSVSTFLATAVLSVASFSAVSTSNAASADEQLLLPPQSPPVITTTSSPQALAISKDLALLNAKMYGVSYIYISCRKNPFGANVLSIYTHTFIFLTTQLRTSNYVTPFFLSRRTGAGTVLIKNNSWAKKLIHPINILNAARMVLIHKINCAKNEMYQDIQHGRLMENYIQENKNWMNCKILLRQLKRK